MNKLKLTLRDIVLILVLLPAFVTGICLFLSMMKADYELYIQESYCVQGLVKSGVERINIATENGKCWVEVNGYHNGYGE